MPMTNTARVLTCTSAPQASTSERDAIMVARPEPLLLLAILPIALAYAPQRTSASVRPVWPARSRPACLQEEPTAITKKVDLASMTFDERLEYLAAESAAAPVVKLPEEEDGTLFGIDGSNEATQWWKPAFWKLCMEDLKAMQWPTRRQTFQTVVVSQVAFVVILVMILTLDAVAESSMRSLLQGKDFGVTLDMVLKKAVEVKS